MIPPSRDAAGPAASRRWGNFDRLFSDRIRASDAAWAGGLQTAERIAIVEDLFATVRSAHELSGDWLAVDALAWADTLDERHRFVTAFDTYGEAHHGRASVAHTD